MSTEALARVALELAEEFEAVLRLHRDPTPGGQQVTPPLSGFGYRLPPSCLRHMAWWVNAIRKADARRPKTATEPNKDRCPW